MHQGRTHAVGGSRKRTDGKRIQRQRVDRMVLGRIDRVVAGTVDDDVRPQALHHVRHGPTVADVEIVAIERRHVVVSTAAFVDQGSAKLSFCARNRDSHQAAFRGVENVRMRSSSNTPSQRATTAVAMQLPITFTAVRPMSMI